MPERFLKPCGYPGCPHLVRQGYCPDHQQQAQAVANAQYHDPASVRMYNSRKWKRMRAAQLAREPWCAACLEQDIYTVATDVDHIEPHRGDPSSFFGGKLQTLCHACHSRKTAQEMNGNKQVVRNGV